MYCVIDWLSIIRYYVLFFVQVLGFDPHLAIQAHGILGDLMLDQSLPTSVVQRLDSVQQLLAPRVTRNVPVSQHLVRTSIQHDRTDYETAIQSISSGSSSSAKRPSLLVSVWLTIVCAGTCLYKMVFKRLSA